jgi:hypothetical protein
VIFRVSQRHQMGRYETDSDKSRVIIIKKGKERMNGMTGIQKKKKGTPNDQFDPDRKGIKRIKVVLR